MKVLGRDYKNDGENGQDQGPETSLRRHVHKEKLVLMGHIRGVTSLLLSLVAADTQTNTQHTTHKHSKGNIAGLGRPENSCLSTYNTKVSNQSKLVVQVKGD